MLLTLHTLFRSRRRPVSRLAAGLLLIVTLGFGGCAQQPQQVAAASHSKEYFPSSVYGAASRRMVADGQPIPRGGGQYLVGKPYTVAGQTYYPSERKISQVGNASWYGDAFHGRLTANGEIYDRDGFTAAHPTMPLPSYARVTNLRNNSSMIVRVNDRGPYASNRVMDVSRRVAEALDFKRYGTARIKVEYVGRASLAGSDDQRLFATLRNDGPAQWTGEPTMVASATAPTRVASIAPYVPETRRSPDPVQPEEAPRRGRARTEQIDREAAVPEPRIHDSHTMDRRVAVAPRADHVAVGEQMRRGHEVSDHPARANKASLMKFSIAKTVVEPPVRPGIKAILPPSRPIDLGTISGADSKIAAHHKGARTATREIVPLRLARFRDD